MFYLYNGIKLPDVGEVWMDKKTYTNATMVGFTEGDKILVLSTAPLYKGKFGATLPASASAIGYTVVDDAWERYYTWEPSKYDSSYTAWGFNIWWASYDVLNKDGTLYLAASDPIPVVSAPAPDPTSMLMGWLAGRAIAGMRGKKETAEPVAYLYNGVRLPKLPEWDKTVYPYAVMDNNGSDYLFSICLCSTLPYAVINGANTFLKTTGAYLYATYSTKGTYGEDWYSSENGSGAYTQANTDNGSSGTISNLKYVMWANCDVYDADGNLYLPASEAVPVYE